MGFDNLWLELDPLSRVFVAAFLLVGVPCLLYLFSMQKDARLVVASVAFLSAALGVAAARDFLRFLIFWELTVLTACYLIVHGDLSRLSRFRKGSAAAGRTPDREDRIDSFTVPSISVAYRYFLVQVVAGASLFFAIAIQYAVRGSFAMDAVTPHAMPFFLLAFLIKAAVVPFHLWVPLTYPRVPPAVTVILSAYSTKIGVYAFARLLPGIPWVAYAGAGTALFGVVMALRQPTVRRFLSYQHVSQVGYILTGIALGTELGMSGGLLQMVGHMAYMSLLFMAAGAVLHRTGTEVLVRVGGAGRWMPLTFIAALVGAAAISGLPPLNGYVSKTLLKTATEGYPILQAALLLAGVGTAFSFAMFVWYLFLATPPAGVAAPARPREMPPGACLAMGILAALCLGQGVFYGPLFAWAFDAPAYPVFGWKELLLGAASVFAGVVLYAAFRIVAGPNAAVADADDAPADIDRLYGWLLHRALGAAQRLARRASDETQAYLLVITALLLALVAFLWS